MNLNAKHIALAELLADPTDYRTNTEKAESVGLSERSCYRLLKTPEFVAHLNEVTTQLVAPLRAKAYRTLDRAMDFIDATSVSAARTVLTAAGDIGSGTNVVTNVTQTQSDDFPNRVERWTRERATTSDKE